MRFKNWYILKNLEKIRAVLEETGGPIGHEMGFMIRQNMGTYVACYIRAAFQVFCKTASANIGTVSVVINVHQDLMFTTVFTHGKPMIVRTCSKQV